MLGSSWSGGLELAKSLKIERPRYERIDCDLQDLQGLCNETIPVAAEVVSSLAQAVGAAMIERVSRPLESFTYWRKLGPSEPSGESGRLVPIICSLKRRAAFLSVSRVAYCGPIGWREMHYGLFFLACFGICWGCRVLSC